MQRPTKYKSINIEAVNLRPVTALTPLEKQRVDFILSKLVQFIKEKHMS